MSTTATTAPTPTWTARGLRLARSLAVIYCGVLLVMVLLENWLVYHPVTAAAFWQEPPRGTVDVTLPLADGTTAHAWYYAPTQSKIAVLYCHGNADNVAHSAHLLQDMGDHLGVAVLVFDYPGYGKSTGRPDEAGCCAAGLAAYQWLRARGHDGAQIILFGNSLGGGVAVEIAQHQPHRALILSRTFTSVPDVGQAIYPWLPVHWLMRNRFDNLAKIPACTRPVVVIHGTADRLIPYAHGEALYRAANEPKLLCRVEGGDHDRSWPPHVWVEAFTFLRKHGAGLD